MASPVPGGKTRDQVESQYKRLGSSDAPSKPKGPKDEDERGAYVFAQYSKQNDHYLGFYQKWTKTIRFLMGNHWGDWNARSRRWENAKDVPSWQQRLVTNYVYAMCRSVMAKMLKQKPALECVPPSGDSDDRSAARLGEALLSYLWRTLNIDEKRRRAMGWYLATSMVFLRVSWDAEAGAVKPITQLVEVENPDFNRADPDVDEDETMDVECPCDDNGAPMVNEDGSWNLDGEPSLMPEGQCDVEIIDPLCVRVNPDATSYDDATEWYIGRLVPKQKALRLFGLKEGELDATQSDEERQFYDDIISAVAAAPDLSANSLRPNIGVSAEMPKGQQVLVIEYYSKPQKGYWKGRHWISIGQKKVWPRDDDPKYPSGESPLPNGFWPPLVSAVGSPIPGQPTGQAALGEIVPLNEQLNTLNSRVREHEIKMALGGKYIISEEDRNMPAPNNNPSQTLISRGYSQGRPPVQMDVKTLPGQIYARITEIRDDIRLVGHMSELSVGQTPEGVTSGRAFLVQEEVSDSVWTQDLQVWERVIEEMGRRLLVVAHNRYTEDRVISVRGDRGQWEWRQFNQADLSDGLDVRVQAGSMAPWSKSAQYDAMISLVTSIPSLVVDPQTGKVDTGKLAQLLSAGNSGLANVQADEDADTVEADRQISMFESFDPMRVTAEGEPPQLPQLGFWMDFQALLQRHYHFLKRDWGRFQRFKPEAQALYLQFLKSMHDAIELQAQQMVGAGVGGAGSPGQPADPNQDPNAPPDAEQAAGGGNPNEDPSLTAAEFAGASQ